MVLGNGLSRRAFIKSAGAVSLGFTGLGALLNQRGYSFTAARGAAPFGYGPVVADPMNIFDLPAGFSYKIISTAGELMTDGFVTPGAPDGMAAFPAPNGRTIVVRNHELTPDNSANGPFGVNNALLDQLDAGLIYDRGSGTAPCLGGTTNIVFNTATQMVEAVRLSLAGTQRNCAGGPTPWGTWITCEESTQRATGNYEEDHGYNFEVAATATGLPVTPVRLTAMGRFNHEAVAVDPLSGVVYQTEDRDDGLIYRFLPNVPGDLAAGGTLQALKVKDQPSLDTRNWTAQNVAVGAQLEVEWIDITNVESPSDNLRFQGFNAGAARFARGEGMWYGEHVVFFACTSGGSAQVGQVWKYTPSPVEGTAGEAAMPGILELFVEPNDNTVIERADNLTVAPWGDVMICEDGTGADFLLGVTPAGDIYKFGRPSASSAFSTTELAGVCFSPDGSTMFINIQGAGLTLAITGPWRHRFGGGDALAVE